MDDVRWIVDNASKSGAVPGSRVLSPIARGEHEVDFFRRMLVIGVGDTRRHQAHADAHVITPLQGFSRRSDDVDIGVASAEYGIVAGLQPPCQRRCESCNAIGDTCQIFWASLSDGDCARQMLASRQGERTWRVGPRRRLGQSRVHPHHGSSGRRADFNPCGDRQSKVSEETTQLR